MAESEEMPAADEVAPSVDEVIGMHRTAEIALNAAQLLQLKLIAACLHQTVVQFPYMVSRICERCGALESHMSDVEPWKVMPDADGRTVVQSPATNTHGMPTLDVCGNHADGLSINLAHGHHGPVPLPEDKVCYCT
jgi:hypothetical protein